MGIGRGGDQEVAISPEPPRQSRGRGRRAQAAQHRRAARAEQRGEVVLGRCVRLVELRPRVDHHLRAVGSGAAVGPLLAEQARRQDEPPPRLRGRCAGPPGDVRAQIRQHRQGAVPLGLVDARRDVALEPFGHRRPVRHQGGAVERQQAVHDRARGGVLLVAQAADQAVGLVGAGLCGGQAVARQVRGCGAELVQFLLEGRGGAGGSGRRPVAGDRQREERRGVRGRAVDQRDQLARVQAQSGERSGGRRPGS